MNEKYSHKDFSNKSLQDHDPKEFNDMEIRGSCFAQEVPVGKLAEYVEVFPKDMTNVTFTGCNLDNVLVPMDCKIADGTHKLIEFRKEMVDQQEVDIRWEMDANKSPLRRI